MNDVRQTFPIVCRVDGDHLVSTKTGERIRAATRLERLVAAVRAQQTVPFTLAYLRIHAPKLARALLSEVEVSNG